MSTCLSRRGGKLRGGVAVFRNTVLLVIIPVIFFYWHLIYIIQAENYGFTVGNY